MSTPPKPNYILIVDDHAVIRAGLRLLLQRYRRFAVIGEAGNRAEALAIATHEQPDMILLDLDLAGENGLDVLPELLAATNDQARVLILTGMRDPEVHRRAFALGAMGVVLKEQASEVLLRAIDKILEGEVWIDRSMMTNVVTTVRTGPAPKPPDPKAAKMAALTQREREIISLICQGLKNQQIAERLFITPATVRNHLNSIYSKLEVSDRLELAVYAYRHGLDKPST